MSSRLREIASSAMGMMLPIADVHICADVDGGASYSYWEQWAHADKQSFHTDIETALSKMTSGRNDCLLLTPDEHTQGDKITWSGNMTHLVGMYPQQFMNQRSRIGHSANFETLLDVTGYGNLFANLYLMYGRDSALNLNALKMGGNRNTYRNMHVVCHTTTELDTAGFELVQVNCNEGYVRDCTFGLDSLAMGATDLVQINGPADRSCRVVFENCTFLMNADAGADAVFIDVPDGNGSGIVQFLNCRFLNIGTSLTYAMSIVGGAQQFFFDNRCTFVGVTDIVPAAFESRIWFGGINVSVGQSAAGDLVALFNGLACHPDVA